MFDYQVSIQPHYEDACRNFTNKYYYVIRETVQLLMA